jgi:hypothetical protein
VTQRKSRCRTKNHQAHRPKRQARANTGSPLRPAPKAPGNKISDRKVRLFYDMLSSEQIEKRIKEVQAVRGRRGFPIKTVILGLMLSQYYRGSVNISAAWEILFFNLREPSRNLLDIPDIKRGPAPGTAHEAKGQEYQRQYNTSHRVYRSWETFVDKFEPHVHDRRRCLTEQEAELVRAAWLAPENRQLIERLEVLAQEIILAPVLRAQRRGELGRWPGHIGVDDTPIPVTPLPPSERRGLASLEIMAGQYVKGGAKKRKRQGQASSGTRKGINNRPTKGPTSNTTWKAKQNDKTYLFAYAAMLVLAGHGAGDLTGEYPSGLCLGMHMHRPGTKPGQAALRALIPAVNKGLVRGLVCADRGITQARAEDFDEPLLELGLDIVKHYRDFEIDLQGEYKGAQLVSGQFYCPLMPEGLQRAGKALVDAESEEERQAALSLIKAREPYRLALKENLNSGDQRCSCPAIGSHAKVVCYRQATELPTPTRVDLDMPKVRSVYSVPHITPPKDDAAAWPQICRQKSITIPGTVLAKWRQRRVLFSPEWQKAWSGLRSQTEGGNGNLKRHCQDNLSDAGARLSHGRVAQTLLCAIIIAVANYRKIKRFRRAQHIRAHKAARGIQVVKKAFKPKGLEALPIDRLEWVDPPEPDTPHSTE